METSKNHEDLLRESVEKSVPDSEYSCDVMCTSLFNRNRLGILEGHTDLAFDACR